MCIPLKILLITEMRSSEYENSIFLSSKKRTDIMLRQFVIA